MPTNTEAERTNESWAVARYLTTPAFAAVGEPTAVCREEDMQLIAVTGPADHRESEEHARLMAAAPRMRGAIEEALACCRVGEPGEAARVLSAALDAADAQGDGA